MGFAESETARVTLEDRLSSGGLRLEHRPLGDVAVPFDKRRDRPALADHDLEEFPYRVRDRAIMAVDQQKIALVVRLFGMPGQMDLAHISKRKIGEVGERGITVVGGRNENVVDVEQQTAFLGVAASALIRIQRAKANQPRPTEAR
jgi:hypothetical protein